MKTRVVITVDVEPSIAGALENPAERRPQLDRPVGGDVDGRSEALGFLIRTLRNYKMNATFFVETVHRAYFPPEDMGYYVETLTREGHDIQLHIHPCWLNFANGGRSPDALINDQCADLAPERLAALIRAGSEQIAAWTGQPPTSMRTGNFSVARGVYDAVAAAGLSVSSSICLAVSPPAEAEPALAGGIHRFGGVTEVPATCFREPGPLGRGRLRPLQVTACAFSEMRHVLEQINAAGGGIAVIVTHPFEFLKWRQDDFADLQPNRLVQRRFAKLCAFLRQNRDRFAVTTMSALAAHLPEAESAIAVDGRTTLSLSRAAANFLNDRLP